MTSDSNRPATQPKSIKQHTKIRHVEEIITARPASDGADVKLLRVFGGRQPERFDPFLLLDEFGSESSKDYIGGFPPHPHRGFQTVTYMLKGKMEHRDHMGNVGLLSDGDVQWMSAARGIIHSEMPKQTEGKMRGFQLWINLAAAEKMHNAAYQDIPAMEIPCYNIDKVTAKALAGSSKINQQIITGKIQGLTTDVTLMDLTWSGQQQLTITLPDNHTALLYVVEDQVELIKTTVKRQQLARLSRQGDLSVSATTGARALLLIGKPLQEPIVQYGPFVMNTMEEIEKAIEDYQQNRLTQ